MGGIYIHTPFCHSKCAYCDFYSMPKLDALADFAAAIPAEWAIRSHEIDEPYTTIYLGGGTPSILPIDLLGRIMAPLPTTGIKEFTIEANPEDVTVDKAAQWRRLGINRVSMGIQSLSDAELKAISRQHTAHQALDAVDALKQAGFDNFSLDLIYGLPGQSLDSWSQSLEQLLSLRPAHFSAYILSYEQGTRLWAQLRSGKISQASDSLITEMYDVLCAKAREHGYEHYEISNFALPGRRAVHNSAYWDGSPYLGLGPSAHSYGGGSAGLRRINPANLKTYLAAIGSGSPAYEIEEEDDNNRFNDLIITALRTADGLDLARVPDARLPQLLKDAAPLLGRGLLTKNAAGRLYIPEPQWLVSDSIMADLLQV